MNTINFPVVGTVYGQWTVVSTKIKKNNSNDKDRNSYWEVQCSCGKRTFRSAYTLTSGKTKACMSCTKTKYNNNTYIEGYFNSRLIDRIKAKGFECNISIPYLEELFELQEHKCALSGVLIKFTRFKDLKDTTASLDRKNSELGYIVGNVQWVHKDINMMKGTLPETIFLKICKIVTEYQSSKC